MSKPKNRRVSCIVFLQSRNIWDLAHSCPYLVLAVIRTHLRCVHFLCRLVWLCVVHFLTVVWPNILIVPRVYTLLGQSMRNTYCRYRLIRSMITLCWTIECSFKLLLTHQELQKPFCVEWWNDAEKYWDSFIKTLHVWLASAKLQQLSYAILLTTTSLLGKMI